MTVERLHGRGIYYLPGQVRCPLAGVGGRGDYESNRIVLDDDRTEVAIDRAAGRITIRNGERYPQRATIADLLFLAEGATRGGGRSPLALHLKVMKRGERIAIDLHRHLRTQEPLTGADFEPFEVAVETAAERRVVLDPARALDLVRRPSLALRLVKALMAMQDLRAPMDPAQPGYCLADLSVGFRLGPLTWPMARARIASLRPDNEALIRRGCVATMLREGFWEMQLTAHTERWLPEVVRRDLFLFGLEDRPLLAEVRARGLRRGQTLGFRLLRGQGQLVLDGQTEDLPAAQDVARAYLEFHMLGGLLFEQAARPQAS